ncbi:acyltransferase-like protein At1g54570, chloroplastic [Momordica charantia]|uniref:Acyltransferase-like protein At1g54570, chloroplastic n=1 Tax=Momordica charantia TaxID=3673 RepID=A0A6J1CPN7_MOMCH|nr:acyltransferase-like protein At1g54570, chloroplastic [Momordica charantia]
MAACFSVGVSPFLASFQRSKNSWRVLVRSEDGADSVSAVVNGASLVGEKEGSWSSFEKGNGWLKSEASEKKIMKRDNAAVKLEPSWDDGYGTVTVKDYFDAAKDFTQHSDGGPPRWFCPLESGSPLKGSPVLLFLPGTDGTGCGLIMHHKALGKAFEVRCLHIPVQDRTPFEGLVKLVEVTIRSEHASSPNKPIYIVGDSFGGCLALAVASRNPKIDLVLILVNPATAFCRSQLQPLVPLLKAMPDVLHGTVLYLLSFVMGEPVKMATVDVESKLPPMQQLEKLSLNLAAFLPYLSELSSIIPKDTLLWKLKLLKSAAAYANSRLHEVTAEVLVLASGKDNMVPSRDEAERLKRSLQNCTSRHFKENGHTLLLEDGIGLMTVIKSTFKYRRSRKHDAVSDYLPPSLTEFNFFFTQVTGFFDFLTGSTMFSTLGDGTVVKGLSGVPDEGPVLLVVPVTGSNLYKLLSENSHVLLYPGGAREAFHRKGEEYKLFWPDQQEFVRMAARFGATILPFGAVGEDDLAQMILDYNDLIKIPMLNDHIRETTQNVAKLILSFFSEKMELGKQIEVSFSFRMFSINRVYSDFRGVDKGEVANQDIFFPLLLPKIPGRFYYLFGKPIVTKGREEILKDKKKATQLYNEVKSEVEHSLEYLIKKRKEDPYRSFVDRMVYKAIYASQQEVPTFEP